MELVLVYVALLVSFLIFVVECISVTSTKVSVDILVMGGLLMSVLLVSTVLGVLL